jgi:hypothetical protein
LTGVRCPSKSLNLAVVKCESPGIATNKRNKMDVATIDGGPPYERHSSTVWGNDRIPIAKIRSTLRRSQLKCCTGFS